VINKINEAPVLPIKPFKKEDKVIMPIYQEKFNQILNNYFRVTLNQNHHQANAGFQLESTFPTQEM
jgi:hypothetical protein